MPEMQKPVLEHPEEKEGLTPSIVRTGETLPQSKYDCQVGNPGLVTSLILNGNHGRAVFDKKKLKQFLQVCSENYLPIEENAEVVGIIPMGLLREFFAEQVADKFSNPLSDFRLRQNQSFPNE